MFSGWMHSMIKYFGHDTAQNRRTACDMMWNVAESKITFTKPTLYMTWQHLNHPNDTLNFFCFCLNTLVYDEQYAPLILSIFEFQRQLLTNSWTLLIGSEWFIRAINFQKLLFRGFLWQFDKEKFEIPDRTCRWSDNKFVLC